MSRIVTIALLAILLLPLSSFSENSDSRIARLARDNGKPVVAQFGDGQCPPCILQDTIIKKVKKEVGEGVIFEFVHGREEFDMTREYKVWTAPTLLFIDIQGVEVARHSGLMKAKALKKKLSELGWI